MSDTKDIIQSNIQKRVEADISQMAKAIQDSMLPFFPNQKQGSYDTRSYVTGDVYQPLQEFLKLIRPIAEKHLREQREREFSNILTNLGSYLEMIQH